MGFAKEVKEYKQNPDMYKAHVGDVSTVLRVALTGRTNTPDMYEIMNVLGKESIQKRFEKAIKLKCLGCEHTVTVERPKAIKMITKIEKKATK